jgi:cytochrome P450
MTSAQEQTIDPHVNQLGDDNSVWFKLSALSRGDNLNPMPILLKMSEKYGPVVPVNMGNERVLLISEPEYFKHVLVTKADDYIKYFDGLKPIFGKAMITHDGALWQKIRMPQQPAFHPDAFGDYIPFFNQAIRTKMQSWAEAARTGETVEMVEQTWTLAADMICKALFDRDMPFNPHVVFKYVKTYTDVQEHKGLRVRKQTGGDEFQITDEDAAKAVDAWWSVPPAVMGALPRDHRQKTLLHLIEKAVADPSIPEFDQQQAIDEIKQYLWAGTETTALTLSWALYLLSQNPEAADRVRRESLAVCGDHDPTVAEHSALNYTRAVIQETMRLYPPVWALIRVATKKDVIGGKEVNPGDRIVLFTYGAHHNPKFWMHPEDFLPERWLGKTKQVKYSYMPFGAGKRSCPGGAMSQVENTLALSILLRRFRPEYVGDVPASINPTVTLTPRKGLFFKIHELS